MNVANIDNYYNAIYKAVVVNSNVSEDPVLANRIQIYIPQLHYKYNSEYEGYMSDTNKKSHKCYGYFPWAVTLVKDLKDGDIVYCSYINNENGSYIIIGTDVLNNEASGTDTSKNGTLSNMTLSGTGIIGLAMPIILFNEISLPLESYPNNIPDSYFTRINPYDPDKRVYVGGKLVSNIGSQGWSIGLIQWHHCRAFDLLYEIAKADTNWKSNFSNTDLQLVQDIQASIDCNSTSRYRTKYQSNFHPTQGTELYEGIKNMLSSAKGKEMQVKLATEDTQKALMLLQGNNYNIQNPAMLIYLLDIMNQYGNGISSKTKASEICAGNGTYMEQLEEFRRYWKQASNNMYTTRRDRTYSYILDLEKQGKLSTNNLVSIPGVDMGGSLLWPAPNCKVITSYYGNRGAIAGTSHTTTNFHKGIDLSKNGGSKGEIIVAAASGTVTRADTGYNGGYGNVVFIDHGNGLSTRYAHQTKFVVKKGDKVTAGQVIGYIGSTGNSSGPHLHFEVRINNEHTNPLPYIKA